MLPSHIYVLGSNELVLQFAEPLQVRGFPIDIDKSLFEVYTNNSSLPRRIASVALDPDDLSRVIIRVSGARLISSKNLDFFYVVEDVAGPVGQLMVASSGQDLPSFGPIAVTEVRPTSSSERNVGEAFSTLTATIDRSRSVRGNKNDNTLTGNDNDNALDGSLGADTMTGGNGNDTYYIDNPLDQVIEANGGGVDTVVSMLDLPLGDYIENGVLTKMATSLTGNDLDNHLTGNGRNNTINGSSGADTMIGLRGNDIYFVDDSSDVVIEKGAIGQRGGPRDRDLIYSDVSYELPEWVETLVLTELAVDGSATGTSTRDTIIGNSSNNRIDGNGSGDTLTGGGGLDVFVINNKPFVYRSRTVPTITDFLPGEDTLEINAGAFGLQEPELGLSFKTVRSRRDLRKALSQPIDFIYNIKQYARSSVGQLYVNLNGMSAGAGAGGMMAIFLGAPSLTLADLDVIFPAPELPQPDPLA